MKLDVCVCKTLQISNEDDDSYFVVSAEIQRDNDIGINAECLLASERGDGVQQSFRGLSTQDAWLLISTAPPEDD